MRRICRTGVLLCGLAAGCTLRPNAALEDQLRIHEDRVFALQHELLQTKQELAAARRESEHLREQANLDGEHVLAAEQADVLFRAEGLRINSLLTGGLDEDGRPGDELLSLVLEPFDADGGTLKLPGDLAIEISDPAVDDAENIGEWTFSADDVRKAWHAGFIVTGFKFRLPLRATLQHETLVVHARLSTTDGRTFDATETINVRVPSAEETLAASNPFE
jgi:hypothetical protein